MSELELQVTLTVVEGPDQKLSERLTAPRTIIGRAGAQIALSDKKVSTEHAAIEINGQEVTIEDLDSRNGVIVNGEKVLRAVLRNLDEIQLGVTRMKILIVEDLDAFKRRNVGQSIFDAETNTRGDIHAIIDDELKRFSKWDLSEPADRVQGGKDPGRHAVGIEFIQGPEAGRKIKLNRETTTLGRGEVDISIRDRDVSRLHATIVVKGKGEVILYDNNSTNGTYVNRDQVTEKRLKTGDIIQIGGTLFRFVMED